MSYTLRMGPETESVNEGLFEVLREVILPSDERLLEVGADHGQYAKFLSPKFPRLEWHPTDKNLVHLKDIHGGKIQRAQRLDVGKDDFPKLRFDVVLTVDTFQVLHWKECKSFMKLLGHRLRENSRAVIVGPFKYKGEFLTEDHRQLDLELKSRDPQSGIRSFEDVETNMVKNGFELVDDHEMPGKVRCLIYVRLKFMSR